MKIQIQKTKNFKYSPNILKTMAGFLLLILTIITQSSVPSNSVIPKNDLTDNDAKITYVGNAGFLIEIGDKKILIDALFKGFAGDYILPEEIQEKLTLAQAPFDDVDLVLVTHAHGDHISADMVQQHMKNNPNAIFASTKQTVDALNASDTIDHFQKRRIGFNPSKEKSDKKEIQGISIETFLLPHGPDSRIINNGFLISVNEITFFHTGDVDFDQFTFEEFRSMKLPERKIDLSFIQHFYLTSDSTSKQFVTKGIGAKYIMPIHYHFTTPSFNAVIVKENYPDAILFNKELESWKMPTTENNLSILNGKYLGQMPPGDTPIIFAAGIVSASGRYEYGVSFTPDLKEIYFTAHKKGQSAAVYFSKLNGNNWTIPKKANLTSGEKRAEMEAFVNPTGDKIYFTAYDSSDVKIWSASRSGDWWINPTQLESPINEDIVFYSNEAKNGNLYYKNVSKGKLYYAPQKDGEFPEIFDTGIEYGSHAFMAPSQDFLVLDAKKENDKTKDKDIHVCFKKEDGTWTNPINLGSEINSDFNETCPSITPDGKYLFFSRYNEEGGIPNVYWVNADIITKVKMEALPETVTLKFTNLKGDYLGQTPPGDVPVVFAPGIISVDSTIEHGSPTFSPDGNEVFWQSNYRQQGKETQIFGMTMRRINGQWTKLEVSPYYSQMVFSLDGKRLYFIPSSDTGMEGVHFVEKNSKGWGKPIMLDLIPRFPDLKYAYSLSFTSDGTVYFFGHAEGLGTRNGFAIYRSELIDEVYAEPELLPSSINMGENVLNWTPFIDPDESYLIFSSNRQGQQDLYISFRKSDGSWSEPKNLGTPFNTIRGERFPTLSPDGKYLFFSRWFERGNEDVMWVSTAFIDKMKEEFNSNNK